MNISVEEINIVNDGMYEYNKRRYKNNKVT